MRWAPSLVEPSLEDGEVLDASRITPTRGDVTGAGGATLVTARPVVRVGLDRARVRPAAAAASARRLAGLVGVDPADFARRVRASGPRAFVEAIVYRRGDVPASLAGLDRIPGAVALPDELPLAPTREFAAPILGTVGEVTAEMVKEHPDTYRAGDVAGLSGLQARYDDQLRGTPGTLVQAVPGPEADPDPGARGHLPRAVPGGRDRRPGAAARPSTRACRRTRSGSSPTCGRPAPSSRCDPPPVPCWPPPTVRATPATTWRPSGSWRPDRRSRASPAWRCCATG